MQTPHTLHHPDARAGLPTWPGPPHQSEDQLARARCGRGSSGGGARPVVTEKPRRSAFSGPCCCVLLWVAVGCVVLPEVIASGSLEPKGYLGLSSCFILFTRCLWTVRDVALSEIGFRTLGLQIAILESME